MAEGRHRKGARRPADDLFPEGYGRRDPAYDDPAYDDPAYETGGYAEPGYDDHGDHDNGGYGYDDEADGGAHAGGGGRGRRSGGSYRRRHPLLAALFVIVVVVVVLVGGGVWWASRQINPGGHPGRRVTVVIPAGSSSSQIGNLLVAAKVIHGSGTLFRYYVRLQSAAPLLAGTYSLATNESYQSVISVLSQGPKLVTHHLVIPEGYTLRQIAERVARLPGMHFSATSFLALSSQGSVRSAYEPPGVNDLEGLVFPATYPVVVGTTTEASLLESMVAAFSNYGSEIGVRSAAARHHLTPYQLVTLASIVQGEAKLDADRPKVASVIYNRLANGTTLGADSTLIYALRLRNPSININSIDYQQDNPYNTRIHKGLPPTPIDNPGLPSLEAAARPAATSYQYFVEVNPDGKLGFATTGAGFTQLQAECRAAKLC